ncbi:MAG: PaaI family thioesterase [Actinomycetota bacterium]
MAEHEIWREPSRGGYADLSFLGLDGMQRLDASVRGFMPPPPIHHLSGLRPTRVEEGLSVFEMPASPWWQTPAGVFTPGVMAFLADAPLGAAVSTALPPGKILATSDLSMSFLRPASVESERLVARGRLIQAGRSLGLSQVTVEDARGRVLAHGTTRCFLYEVVSPPPEPPAELVSYERPVFDTPDPYLRDAVGEILSQDVWDRMTGLEILQAFVAQDLPSPPLGNFLGGRWVEAGEGAASFALPMTEWLNSPGMRIYGGAIAFLADIALAGAVQTTVPARSAFSPLDLKVNFVRPVVADGRDLVGHGTVVHRGRTLAVANASLVNADGKVVALASGSTLILPDRPWMPGRPVVAEEEAAADSEEDGSG